MWENKEKKREGEVDGEERLSEVQGMQTYGEQKLTSWMCWCEPVPREPDCKPNYIHV